MRARVIPTVIAILLAGASSGRAAAQEPNWGIVIHGGAGTIERGRMTAERETAVRARLGEALEAGHAVLASGGASLDAVQAAIRILEDSPLFNAGTGAVRP